MNIKFLSIDASMSNTGVAIGDINEQMAINVHEIHLVQTEKTKNKRVRASSDTIQRCRDTHQFLSALLETYKPQVVFAETPSGSQSAAGMKSYGIVCMLLGVISPPPVEVTPDEIKKAVSGKKSASKQFIIDWAYQKYPHLEWRYHRGSLQAKNEHCADAIGAVYAGIKTDEFQRLFNLIAI